MSSGQVNRLPAPWGTLLERDKPVSFKFEGQTFTGLKGDSLSSALAANGQFMLSRSFKYHRPRGSYSFAGFDSNSYVQVGNEPNVPADLTPADAIISASAQNVLGSLRRDFGSGVALLKPFLPVGFYYRAFFRPRPAWKIWERLIRMTTGLGRISTTAADHPYRDKQYLHTDVAVIGAGPAGISAALAAARGGADVILIEESTVIGGSLNYARFGGSRDDVDLLRRNLCDEVAANSDIRMLTNATCSGWFPDNWLSVAGENRLYKIRARRIVLATGSVEQPAVFRNNDLPGVLPASAAQRLVRLYGVKPGSRAVVVAANSEGDDVAKDLAAVGVHVAEVVDMANDIPVQAVPGTGKRSVTAIEIANRSDPTLRRIIDCDLIVTSVGYAPLGQLACHDGGRLEYDDDIAAFRIRNCPIGGDVAGSVNHCYDLDVVLRDGAAAGSFAAQAAKGSARSSRDVVVDTGANSINHPYPVFPHPKGNEYVDFDEDQTIADLVNAVADGFDDPELAKRYSTTAMGPSQGRLSATNALRIVTRSSQRGERGASITTQRPPFRPVPFSLLAGRSFEPERRTAMHAWHVESGAQMMPAGVWQRPAYYGTTSERERCINDEVHAVRNSVGMIDVSTLGGIEIRGPNTADFLNRIYTFTYLKQPVDKSRYVLMADESGSVIDDGVACRLAEDFFYVTTTTTGSDAVYRTMLRRNIEWQTGVEISNVTSALAAINIAGPLSRQILVKLDCDIDFSQPAFPYLGVRRGTLLGMPVIAVRVGFVGELGYELHVPSSRAMELWSALMTAGQDVGIRPVGIEAQRVLRLEKGHIIVGQDSDGLTNPLEADMSWAVSRKKPYFVGHAAISAFETAPSARKLVGFEVDDGTTSGIDECNLVLKEETIAGRVTSVAHSRELNKLIGLAYVHPVDSEPGCEIEIRASSGLRITAQVVALPFLDPDGLRQER